MIFVIAMFQLNHEEVLGILGKKIFLNWLYGEAAGAVLIAVVALIVVVVHKTAPSQVQINVAPSQIPSSQKPTQVIRNATSVSDTATAPRTRPGILSPLGAPSSKAVQY